MSSWLLKRVIIVGVILLVAAVIVFAVMRSDKSSQIVPSNQEESLALEQEYDEAGEPEKEQAQIIDEDTDESTQAQQFDVSDHGFILNIATDDLAVYAPVFDGVTDQSLSRGIGRHVSTAEPNEDSGNVVLSGHQWYPGDAPGYKVFENLDALSKNDDVSIEYGGKRFTYKVREVKVVEPTDVSILEQTDSPQLTLYTCYPRFSTEKRLVYIADLINVQEV